jgi:DNA (cytosine-5)-methyltransferase 3A
MKIKVLSLFDGISVAQQALKELGYDVEYYASEIDKYAMQITQKNHPKTVQVGSVVDIKVSGNHILGNNFASSKDNFDLLIGGSPCQDLSIAGKRAGLSGARSGLFYEYVRILKEVKPKYFVLENVFSMPQEARDVITKEMGVEPIMINANLVSAQNRKRLFWTNIPNITQPEDKGIILKDILEQEVDEKYFLTESNIKTINRNFGSKGKVLDMTQDGSIVEKMTYPNRITQLESPTKCPTLTSSMGTGGGNVPVIVRNQGKEIVRETDKSSTLMARDYKGFGNQEMTGNIINNRLRKLTPIECERLQSLPDNYTEGVSNSQRYKALGNAFNKEVVKHILGSIK